MLADSHNPTVPQSHTLVAGHRDSVHLKRDSGGTPTGTIGLKALATAILQRDTSWDSGGTSLQKSVPIIKPIVGQFPMHWDASDWQEYYDERAGVAEHCSGMPREKAEKQAYEACVVRWLNTNPEKQINDSICPHCHTPNGAIGLSSMPVLNGSGHVWLHRDCHASWMAQRRLRAIETLEKLGIRG